jgi:hypothetical protein
MSRWKARTAPKEKPKGEAYRRFVATVLLDHSYLDAMLESRYARHFYSDEETLGAAPHVQRIVGGSRS